MDKPCSSCRCLYYIITRVQRGWCSTVEPAPAHLERYPVVQSGCLGLTSLSARIEKRTCGCVHCRQRRSVRQVRPSAISSRPHWRSCGWHRARSRGQLWRHSRGAYDSLEGEGRGSATVRGLGGLPRDQNEWAWAGALVFESKVAATVW